MKLSYLSVLLIILFPIFVFFLTRGVVIHDEGYILNSSEKLLEGLIPYRDFSFVYTPGSLFVVALFFIILGPSILTSRILMIFIALITSFLIFKIIYLSTKNKFYATLGVLLFTAWGPTHINFAWPIMFVIPITFALCFLILKFLETRNTFYLFLAGLAAFLILFFKQNFGFAIIIPVIAFFLAKNSRKLKYILDFSYGYIWGLICFIIYLLFTNSFPDFVNDIYLFTFQRIISIPNLTTPFIYQDTQFLKTILRTTFYLLPLIASILAFLILYIRRRFHLLFLPILVGVYFVFGIRPTTDYVHLAPLLSLIGIPVALFLRYNIQSTLRFITIFSTVILIVLGFQTALFKGYYRWDYPLISHNNFFPNSKGNIFVNFKLDHELSEFVKIINNNSEKGDYIFVNSYNPMIYFITDRKEPIKSGFLKIQVDQKGYYEEVNGNLIAKKVRILILDHNNIDQLPIKNYILKNYTFNKTVVDFDVYLRNK